MKTWTRIALILAALVLIYIPSASSGNQWEPAIPVAAAPHMELDSHAVYGPIPPPGGAPAATAATVSGIITRQTGGTPVENVAVTVSWPGGSQTVSTNSSGYYTVTNVLTGGTVRIGVIPQISDRLASHNWIQYTLTSDLVKNFSVEDGYLLQGELVMPNGDPYGDTLWVTLDPLDFDNQPNEWFGVTAVSGLFELVLPQNHLYSLEPDRPYPFWTPWTRVNLTGDTTGLGVQLAETIQPPFPTEPPQADLVSVGTPDVDGNAAITGTAGAVEPFSAVMIINVNSRNLITTTSDVDGAFTANLYAPLGSTLMVRYDREWERVVQLWEDAFQTTKPDLSYMTVLPGTLIHAGPASTAPEHQDFYAVSSFINQHDHPSEWTGWALSGELYLAPGTPVTVGETIDFHTQVRITSPAISCTVPVTYNPSLILRLRYLFDHQGHSHPWGSWFTAHLFTPTGLPIEHEAWGETVFLTSVPFEMWCESQHTLGGIADGTITVPNVWDGTYILEATVTEDSIPRGTSLPLVPVWHHPSADASLPLLTIGDPAPPRIPWTLLADYPINGNRGVHAREDAGHYAMPYRIVCPPHQVVVPRFNTELGIPLTYRLEPASNWISSADRRFPNPPRIPLQLPAGYLFVQVHKPDGSTDTLEAPIVQSSARTPTLPGGTYTNFGTGHNTDIYHVTTLNEGFDYAFDQDGHHIITMEGHVEDIYGNFYPIGGTYDVIVANILDLDPGQLPTTPYEVGDAFSPGLHVFPPSPAEVTIELVHMPYSEPGLATTTIITGNANRFGYFQPPVGTIITFTAPGEFRVDYTAVFTDPDGGLWVGTMTYGNVVETPDSQIIAHGRRGMDYHGNLDPAQPAWFEVLSLPTSRQGIEVYYPYFSGDIHWGDQSRQLGDSIHTIISIEDRDGYDGPIYNLLRAQWPSRSGYRWPPDVQSLAGLNQRLAVDEAPLYITTNSGLDPAIDPSHIDMWGYWYGSSERPDVHVREIISEDDMGTAYWRFNDTYGYQIGEGAKGDLPGDIKWEFGGAVLRYIDTPEPIIEYSIYSSLWVLLPDNDPVGARITAPFRGAGDLDGGPIMTIGDEGIDMLFLPKGVRPGDILHLGDAISFSGHVGPPLNSLVSVTITAPSLTRHTADLRANKIGWVYDPVFDFPAEEVGRWTVDVHVVHDQEYEPTGLNPSTDPYFSQFNTGTVLGTQGQYEFYVVEPESPRLYIASPEEGPITWPAGEIEPIVILGYAPPGTAAVHYTIHDKGVVMEQGITFPDGSGRFEILYDAETLNATFPFVSLTSHNGEWEGLADEVTINMLAIGDNQPRAANVTLIGEEIFIGNHIQPAVYLPLIVRQY